MRKRYLVASWFLLSMFACLATASAECPSVTDAFPIADDKVVAGEKEGVMVALVDVSGQFDAMRSMTQDAIAEKLKATVAAKADAWIGDPQVDKARADVIAVTSLDEYNNPNVATALQIGTVPLARKAGCLVPDGEPKFDLADLMKYLHAGK